MNIYRIDTNNESTWVCADTNIQALRIYEKITDIGLVDYDNHDEIIEVPKEEWSKLSIIDINAEMIDGEYPSITFEKYMRDAVTPDIIACTAY